MGATETVGDFKPGRPHIPLGLRLKLSLLERLSQQIPVRVALARRSQMALAGLFNAGLTILGYTALIAPS